MGNVVVRKESGNLVVFRVGGVFQVDEKCVEMCLSAFAEKCRFVGCVPLDF